MSGVDVNETPVLERRVLEDLIFRSTPLRRYTQDSPVLPEVWFEFGRAPDERVDLLLTPVRSKTPGDLFKIVRERLDAEHRGVKGRVGHRLAYSQSTLVGRFSFDELMRVVIPLSNWQLDQRGGSEDQWAVFWSETTDEVRDALAEDLMSLEQGRTAERDQSVLWMIRIAGTIQLARRRKPTPTPGAPLAKASARSLVDAVLDLVKGIPPAGRRNRMIFMVSRNRPAASAVYRSVPAVKADAARRLFKMSCEGIRWAVLDSGLDARHPAFRCRGPDGKHFPSAFVDEKGREANRCRIVATYDFTRIRELLDPHEFKGAHSTRLRERVEAKDGKPQALMKHLESGRQIDWDLFAPVLRVPHTEDEYVTPRHEHGTHVAGILGGDWKAGESQGVIDNDLVGVCPDISIYDIRVLDEKGQGDEFSIIAALQFLRHLNANKDHQVVHGVNMSLAIPHDVANYACGRTPVCEEAERMWHSGVVVVAAAGNEGYVQYVTAAGLSEGYRNISITDPGNSESVITVGSTHRYRPHTYGVSYFSSRGPTGDGRVKPDLVAPGEKIWSSVPEANVRTLDGTSMAAPHVSGCAALLLARHRELVGDPGRVKAILRETATDLNRERYFQGAGMVDVLRAVQSV